MHTRASTAPLRRAGLLLAVRLLALLAWTGGTWVVVRAASGVDAFPPSTVWATLGLLPINVLCLVMVRRFYRAEGTSLRDALGVRRGRLGRDLLWGVLWLFVLNIPFALVVAAAVFVLYGADAPAAFATIFFDPESVVPVAPGALLVISLVAVVPFMLINAPTEELVFRGYALEKIASRWGGVAAIVVTSILFGVQHVLFAATAAGMLVYVLAFTVWGLCAAIIVRRQGRLFPVVIAHGIVNVMMSSPAIVLPILQLAGLVPAS